MKVGQRDHRFFENWARRNGMRPVVRVTDVKVNGTSVGDILVADSGELLDVNEFPPMPGQDHGLTYFFRTGFAIDRPGDKTWLAAFNDYGPGAFLEYGSSAARLAKRVEEATAFATEAIAQTHKVGLYGRQNGSLVVG